MQNVIDRLVGMGFTVHRSTGVRHTVLGGVGPVDDFDPADFEVMDGVKECHRIISPYKLASRHFRPGGTVVRIGDSRSAAMRVVTMAGPCSIENAEQSIERLKSRRTAEPRFSAEVRSNREALPTVFRAWANKA